MVPWLVSGEVIDALSAQVEISVQNVGGDAPTTALAGLEFVTTGGDQFRVLNQKSSAAAAVQV
jgi:hypothetical protein